MAEALPPSVQLFENSPVLALKKGAGVKGQAITAMSFVTETHGFATAVNGLQICSLLEFGAAP